MAQRQASLGNSGSVFMHAVALPVPKSVSGRTRHSNYFGALRARRPVRWHPNNRDRFSALLAVAAAVSAQELLSAIPGPGLAALRAERAEHHAAQA
jgi:hypothetical protein